MISRGVSLVTPQDSQEEIHMIRSLSLRGHYGWILKKNWKFHQFFYFLLNDARIHLVLDCTCILGLIIQLLFNNPNPSPTSNPRPFGLSLRKKKKKRLPTTIHTRYSTYKSLHAQKVIRRLLNEISPSFLVISKCTICFFLVARTQPVLHPGLNELERRVTVTYFLCRSCLHSLSQMSIQGPYNFLIFYSGKGLRDND